MLLAPGCGTGDAERGDPRSEPVRRAISAAWRRATSCCPAPAAPRGPRRRPQIARYEELKQLGDRKGAGHALWLGENDWAGGPRGTTSGRAARPARRRMARRARGDYDRRGSTSLAGRIADSGRRAQ